MGWLILIPTSELPEESADTHEQKVEEVNQSTGQFARQWEHETSRPIVDWPAHDNLRHAAKNVGIPGRTMSRLQECFVDVSSGRLDIVCDIGAVEILMEEEERR